VSTTGVNRKFDDCLMNVIFICLMRFVVIESIPMFQGKTQHK
jgi:hypothetical protein